jgi:hypothetical protein
VVTSRTLDIANLNITTSTSNFADQANDFGVIAHELFHAYQDVVEGLVPTPYWKSSQVEIDAFLFQYMACTQMDQNDKISPTDFGNSYTDLSINLYTESEQAANDGNSGALAFFNAWQNMFQSGQFTLTNYNALVTNFHDADINNGYSTLTTTADTQAAFTSSAIETFYAKDYEPNIGSFKPLFDPLKSNSSASSGGTDGNTGVGIIITPNGGVVVSTSNSTTYLPSAAPSSNSGAASNAGVTETPTGATAVGAVHATTPVVNSDGTVTYQIVDSQGTVIETVTVSGQVAPPTSSLQDPTTPSGVAYVSSSSDDGDDGSSGSSTDTSYDV